MANRSRIDTLLDVEVGQEVVTTFPFKDGLIGVLQQKRHAVDDPIHPVYEAKFDGLNLRFGPGELRAATDWDRIPKRLRRKMLWAM